MPQIHIHTQSERAPSVINQPNREPTRSIPATAETSVQKTAVTRGWREPHSNATNHYSFYPPRSGPYKRPTSQDLPEEALGAFPAQGSATAAPGGRSPTTTPPPTQGRASPPDCQSRHDTPQRSPRPATAPGSPEPCRGTALRALPARGAARRSQHRPRPHSPHSRGLPTSQPARGRRPNGQGWAGPGRAGSSSAPQHSQAFSTPTATSAPLRGRATPGRRRIQPLPPSRLPHGQ